MHAVQEPQLLGTTENELGLRKWIEEQGHELVTTSDKEGEHSSFEKQLVDAEVIITTPYVLLNSRVSSYKGCHFAICPEVKIASNGIYRVDLLLSASTRAISPQTACGKPRSSDLPSQRVSDPITSTST